MKNTCSRILFLIGEKKLRLITIFFISLFISIMEMLSISLIVPIIAFIFNSNFIVQIKNYITFFNLNSFTNEHLIFLLIIFIFIVFFIKFIINCFLIVLKNNFTFIVRDRLIEKLYINLLSKNENFINSNHSSKVILKTTVLVDDFAVSVLDKSIEFLSDSIMITALFVVVLFLQTKISLIALSFFIFFFLIHRAIIKNKASAWGQARLDSDLKIQKYISETFNTIREIKIYLKQNYFINNIKYLIKNNSTFSKKQMKTVDFQKHIIEIIVIIFFLFSVYFMKFYTEISNLDLITFLAVLSGVLFKMLPAANRILNNLQRISFALPSINSLYDELNSYKHLNSQDYILENDYLFNKKISLVDLNYIYNKKKIFIKDLNFEILRGDCFGIIGESGAGKTTLIKILIGLLNDYQGKILIDDINLNTNIKHWFSKISYVPQSIFLLDNTIRANVAFGEFDSEIDDFKVKKSLVEAQISEFSDNLDLFVGERGSKISGGQQQRIMIARALYRKPEIIFFDEATSALDIDNEKKILNTIQSLKNKYTIIISTHRSETLSICNKVYDIKNNKFI